MENHPIPQDITGFQFKLIGNMTVKQFAYLAVGAVLGWIIFAMPLSLIIKFPVALFFVAIGTSFAFLPIDGRPLDIMITNFIKALSKPTQFVYQKVGANLYFPEVKLSSQTANVTHTPNQNPTLSGDKLKTFLASLPTRSKNKLDEKEATFLQTLNTINTPNLQPRANQSGIHFGFPKITPSIFSGNKQPVQQPIKADAPLPQPQPKPQEQVDNDAELQNAALALKTQLEQAKKEEANRQSGTKEQEEAHQKVLQLEKILNETLSQKQQLESQLIELQKKLEQQGKNVFAPSMATPEIKQTKRVRSIPREMGKSVGLPIASDFPNVINGIVKDPRGNPLPGILVEVKDEEANPIRAFKTNPLGQFASATPLSNGTYTIDFEDPAKRNRFDTIQFSATGEIILPIEVISVDEREDLRKSLFGQ